MPRYCWLSVFLLCISSATGMASERLTGIACRSVHLQYPGPESSAFYNELTVEQSAEGSYFMACGFSQGYFGIQQLPGDRKVVLFSVWDPGTQNDPEAAPVDRRVEVLGKGPDVDVKRFGGEGTGGQSFFEYDWQMGETIRFLVTAKSQGERTAYSGYFFVPADQRWQKMAEFSTPAGGHLLRGYYSFVEDFQRNRTSTTHTRKALFGNGWVKKSDGWSPLDRAKFTADGNRAMNINAGILNDRFFLATGGEIENDATPLWGELVLPQPPKEPPSDLPDAGRLRS